MNIQSLSVVVPAKKCINNCKFCVTHMHEDTYKNQMDDNLPFFDLYIADYLKRLEFARNNGCNTVMLTGDAEPQQNRKFLTYFGMFMKMMRNPFEWIEMQTTGVGIDRNYLRFLRNHVGVNLISLSVSSFDNEVNRGIIRMPGRINFHLASLCKEIKEYDFALRLSLNMTDAFEDFGVEDRPEDLFLRCKELGADQVTLRGMYSDDSETEQAEFVREHAINLQPFIDYVLSAGRKLAVLPYGATKYSVNGMSVVIDCDCMSKAEQTGESYKYLILRPNCKLYSQWDDPASLIF